MEEAKRERENEIKWPSNAKARRTDERLSKWHIKSANICAASGKYIINGNEEEKNRL